MATDDTRIDLGIDGLGPAEHIGSGGFADVYRAEQLSLRRIVAVKVLRAQVTDDEAEARFERECYALGAVSDHPHIVAVHEGGFTRNGRAYLVMEYLPGGSLLDRLERFGVMSPADVVQIGRKIGTALHVAHEAGVLHRDVKPANIMISKLGEPALGDFGIARIEGGHQTATGVVTESFLHSSPEVLEGQPVTPGADIYSLASTMYQLVSGMAPYYRASDENVWPAMERILSDPMPSPAPFGMSAEFCQLFDRSTARNPNLRYRDAGEFVEDLRRTNPGSVRDRDDANLRAELAAAASVESPSSGHPVDLAPKAPFLDHTLGMEPAPTAEISGTVRTEFKARQKPIAPLAARDATPIGKPDVTTISSLDHGAPIDAHGPPRATDRMSHDSPEVESYIDPEWELQDRRRSSNRVGLKALAVAALSVLLVAGVAFGAFRLAQLGASKVRESQTSDAALDAPEGAVSNAVIEPSLAVPATSSVQVSLVEAELGPLLAGQRYTPTINLAIEPESVNYLIDGTTASTDTDGSFVMLPGRHALQAEILLGENQGVTTPIGLFGLEDLADTGLQVNLGSAPSEPQEWSNLLAAYDRLVEDGHDEVTIARDDQPAGSLWWIFVPGFGDDVVAAEAYCQSFDLAIPDQCFTGPALVSPG